MRDSIGLIPIPISIRTDPLTAQVRAMQDLLPYITIVKDDPFNSDPNDPNLMGPDARIRYLQGEKLPVAEVKTPLVRSA